MININYIIITLIFIILVVSTMNYKYKEKFENTNIEIKENILGWRTGKIIPTHKPKIIQESNFNNRNILKLNTLEFNTNMDILLDLININQSFYTYFIYTSKNIGYLITRNSDIENKVSITSNIWYYLSYNINYNIIPKISKIAIIDNTNYMCFIDKYININNNININTLNVQENFTIHIYVSSIELLNITNALNNESFIILPNNWYIINYIYIINSLEIRDDKILNIYNPRLEYNTQLVLLYKFNLNSFSNSTIFNLASGNNINDARMKYIDDNNNINDQLNLIYDNKQPIGNGCLNLKNNSYIEINKFITKMDGITFSFWCKINNYESSVQIFDFGNGNGKNNILFGIYNNTISASVYTNNGNSELINFNTININNNMWIHIVWILDPLLIWKFYINNVLINIIRQQKYPENIIRKLNYIGKSNMTDSFLNGSICDFRMYNSILTDNEISALYNYKYFNILNSTPSIS